jgi:CBS domain-containing protein
MRKISDILASKGSSIFSVRPTDTVYDALKVLLEKNIGALVVMEGSDLKGIFSERDYARRGILEGRASKETRIEEIMTANPITISVDGSLEEAMTIMSLRHFRHLPVMNHDGKLAGVISLGDVVKFIINEQKGIINNLELYIHGSVPHA